MKNTGHLLKHRRESAKLSISEVALATKINPKILVAMENGDETGLPAKIFLKGFIRSYALFLKLDAEEVLRTYLEETGGAPIGQVHEAYKPAAASPAGTGPRQRVAEENSSGLRTAAIVVIVLLIGVIIGVRELIEKYQREKIVENSQPIKISPLSPQPPAAPENHATDAAVTAPDTVTVPPGTIPAPAVNAKATAVAPVPAAEPEVAPVTVPTPARAPAPHVKAEAAPPPPKPEPVSPPTKPEPAEEPETASASAAPVIPPVPSPVAAVSPPAVPQPAPKTPDKILKNEIILEALDKVEVKLKNKGETKVLSLAPNQVHTIHSDQPVVLDLSDGGAVNIIVNGRERGPPGDLGKPKQITIP